MSPNKLGGSVSWLPSQHRNAPRLSRLPLPAVVVPVDRGLGSLASDTRFGSLGLVLCRNVTWTGWPSLRSHIRSEVVSFCHLLSAD